MKRVIILGLLSFAMVGCGTIDNQIATTQSIQSKTADAIGVTPGDIKIFNREGRMESVHYEAMAHGAHYRCYYSTAVLFGSDALCTKMDDGKGKHASHKSKSCNALLSAAGRC
ncbi:type 2 periplasmic-binding domain-containing protein [Dongshaea marina]|uniref:hypothetical protein n=1 Tax=Dongshaea marina TaxID=2047966 RepID=UPI000D3E9B30|nr:hypothetical protein [Dongshaea marina]